MKKIYVYVGQLRGWMQRVAKRVKRELFSSMNGKVDGEILCAAQDDKLPMATDEGAEVNEVRMSKVERRRSNDDGKSPNSNGETLLVRAERYLWERYEFRDNVLARGYEYREVSAMPVSSLSSGEGGGRGRYFRPLDEEQRRYLLMQLQHAGINVPYISHIQAIVDCGRATRYNPVTDYFACLPEWDGKDHIGNLMRRVTGDEFALTLLRRWTVAVVAQALGRMGRYGNCLCPLLISERQGWGKSQFTKLLMPPELMVHYTDTFNLVQEEQCLRKMGQHLLVNLDEFDRHSATAHATLKGLLQLADIKVKRPHRAQFEEMPRMASFIGTSNRRMLLRDRTGSRRYICVELSAPIDVDTPVDHAQLYAQALHLLDEGMRYWLDEEETLRLEEHNAPYKMEHGPEELLTQHFSPVAKKKHYADDELWSAVAVYDYLHRIDPLLMRSVERTTFGMYVRRMGFEQVRRENKRYFALRAN